MGSILNDVKKMLGIPEDVSDFDKDLIIFINTIFSSINQMGIGPMKCFKINGKDETWNDFDKRFDMEEFKTYLFIKVKMLFDPPANNQLSESYNNTVKELEFRIHSLWDIYMKSSEDSIREWVNSNK